MALMVKSNTHCMLAARYIAPFPSPIICLAPLYSIPASKVERNPATIIGRLLPHLLVLWSDQVPTMGPTMKPTTGPALLFSVANESVAPNEIKYEVVLGPRKIHSTITPICGRAIIASFQKGHSSSSSDVAPLSTLC